MNNISEFVIGILLGVMALACFSYPQVGRAIGKLVAVIGIAVGAGLITWGVACSLSDDFVPMQSGPIFVVSISQVFGWGIGLTAGGITALVLALVGRESF